MNILYIWDADYPWDVRVEKICQSLFRCGHNVHVAARNLRGLPEHEEIDGLMIHRLRPLKNGILNKSLSFPAFFSPIWKRFLDGLMEECRIDLIIVRDLPLALAGIKAGRRHQVPVIFDMAEDYVALIRDIWKSRKFQGFNFVVRNPYLARIVERYALRGADHILVVIDEAKDLVIKRGADPEKISIVGNTPTRMVLSSPAAVFDHTLGKIVKRTSLIYTGGIQMGRGIQVVFDALPEIIKKIPDILFVIVGTGYAVKRLNEMALDKQLQEHVLWTGWIEHDGIFDYIRASKIGIIPHLTSDHVNTTIPNKIFDYMSLGIPVIASDAIPMKRIIEETRCGRTFRSGDGHDLAKAVVETLESRFDYGRNGIEAIRKQYHWEVDEERLLGVVAKMNCTSLPRE